MTTIPPYTSAQPRPDSSNPHLVALLTVTLGERGWTFPEFVKTFRLHRNPEWLAGVTKLAHEMGLIAPVEPKAKKAKQPSEHDDEPPILPVPLRPQSPKPAKIIKLSDRREPARWMEGESDDEQR